jgi:hypothetical protein
MRIPPRALIAAIMSALAMSALGGTERSEAFDYMTNGGFESGVDGWSAPQTTDFDAVAANVVTPREGGRSARISIGTAASAFAIRQTSWAGSRAGTYEFSAWVRPTSRSTEVYIQAIESNTQNTLRVTAMPSSDQWVEVSGTIQITGSNNVVLAIGGSGSGGDVIYVDDVRFEGADPATMTPTATFTEGAASTAPAGASATRTPTGTRTPSPTKTASATPLPTTAPIPIGGVLQNAGFEVVTDDGVPESWSKYGGALQTSDRAHGAARSARLESTTDSTKWLYQTVLVDGGDAYEFGAWVLDDDANVASAFLRISWYASDDGSGSASGTSDSISRLTSPAGDYRHLTTGAVVAPDDAHSARVRIVLAPLSSATAAIYADDASFAAVDPPPDEDALAPASISETNDDTPPDGELSAAPALVTSSGGIEDEPLVASGGVSGPHVVINEVLYDPDGPGADSDGEWVELYNPTDASIPLGAWSLSDAASADAPPATTIAPHGYAVFAASDSFNERYPGFDGSLIIIGGRIGNSLGNDGDRLVLRDRSGALVDAVSWGTDASVFSPAIPDVPSGHLIERRIAGQDGDVASDFIDNMHPSPGAAFVPTESTAPSARAQSDAPVESQVLAAGGEPSFSWLPWALSGAASLALVVTLSWRLAPPLVQRRRQRS